MLGFSRDAVTLYITLQEEFGLSRCEMPSNQQMKKRSERRKHCAHAAVPHRRTESAMAVVRQSQNFPPAADPLPGAQDCQNLISWKSAPIDPVW